MDVTKDTQTGGGSQQDSIIEAQGAKIRELDEAFHRLERGVAAALNEIRSIRQEYPPK